LQLFAGSVPEDFPDNYFAGQDVCQAGYRCAQCYEIREECNSYELRGGVTVSGVVGGAFVGVRVCDELSVDNVRVGKTGDAYHVAAKERQQQAGEEAFLVTYRVVHTVGIIFLTVQR
jgi:hypothetical protein